MAEPDYPVNPTYTPFVLLGRAINLSGYVLNIAKLLAMPEDCFEVQNDHLRERETQTDGEVTRVWDVPWSSRHAWRAWVLGYSTSSILAGSTDEDIATAAQYYANTTIPPTAPPPNQVGAINRVIPAQDHERPWLFASSCELIAGKGAVAPDPENIVLNQSFQPVVGADNEVMVAPCVAYVDNDQGGYTGIELLDGVIAPLAWEVSDGRAFYRVAYKPRDYNVLADSLSQASGFPMAESSRWTRVSEEYNVEGIPLMRLGGGTPASSAFVGPPAPSSNMLMFVNGGTGDIPNGQIPEAGVYQLQTAMILMDWLEVPDRPTAAFLYCLGKVNSVIFPFNGSIRGSLVYPPGTLFCWPWRTKQTTSITGRPVWEIHFRFGYKPWGWNNFPYPTATGISFAPATFGGAANPTASVYQTADFNCMFVVPPPVIYVPPGSP